MSTARKLTAEALQLDDVERATMALELMDSITRPDPRDEAAWIEEIEGRARRVLAGEAELRAAATWYKERSPEVARRFLGEARTLAGAIARKPLRFPVLGLLTTEGATLPRSKKQVILSDSGCTIDGEVRDERVVIQGAG
jgi:hypothetical protein